MKVLIELHEGRMAAPLLDNGLLRFLVDDGSEVLVISPAARVPTCVERWNGPKIEFRQLPTTVRSIGRFGGYENLIGRWLSTHGYVGLRRAMWRMLGEPNAARRSAAEAKLLGEWKPDVVVATHLENGYGRGLVANARQMGIPTVGNLVSWDNAYRPLRVRPNTITCWSERNRQELREMCAYRDDEIKVIGAPAFDAYFAPEAEWSREELCAKMGLEPERPIILFATLGQMSLLMDETSSFEIFLGALEAGRVTGAPQVVLRLHPTSRDVFFERFVAHKDVTLSRYEGYVPWMGWTPWRDEIILAGNLLRHADVCVSPGSTMTIESAIFDTPTVMPVMNSYQSEIYRDLIDRTWLGGHFKPMADADLLPIAETEDELIKLVNEALKNREWYKKQRREIREILLGPLDGLATERLATVILGEGGGVRGRMS